MPDAPQSCSTLAEHRADTLAGIADYERRLDGRCRSYEVRGILDGLITLRNRLVSIDVEMTRQGAGVFDHQSREAAQ